MKKERSNLKKLILILLGISLLLGGTIFIIYKNNKNTKEEVVDIFKEEKEEVKEEPPKEETIDLFKEEEVPKKIEVPEPIPKETAEVSKKASSIYDILENNSNIIWKTTDTSKNNNKIPVIGNNKLKPEIINNNDNISFPDLKKKEGEVLWKETL